MNKTRDIYQFQSQKAGDTISIAWSFDAKGQNLPNEVSHSGGLFVRQVSWEYVRQLSASEARTVVGSHNNFSVLEEFGYLIEDRAVARK